LLEEALPPPPPAPYPFIPAESPDEYRTDGKPEPPCEPIPPRLPPPAISVTLEPPIAFVGVDEIPDAPPPVPEDKFN
jgi:hypothetical protein